MAVYSYKRNDTGKLHRVTLSDAAGVVDLTNAAAVRFHMYREDTRAQKVNAAMTIQDAAGGIVRYAWQAADVDTAGRFLAEIEVTWQDATETTFPNTEFDLVVIHDDLS